MHVAPKAVSVWLSKLHQRHCIVIVKAGRPMNKAACTIDANSVNSHHGHGLKQANRLLGGMGPSDYQRVMHTRPVAKTAHFTVHFHGPVDKLSTAARSVSPPDVDDTAQVNTDPPCLPLAQAWRLGLVLPKKMARRSVTRSLIKHQARDVWRGHLNRAELPHDPCLPAGDWVLRLKAPWPVAQFPSAASEPLKQLVRQELVLLLQDCISRTCVAKGMP